MFLGGAKLENFSLKINIFAQILISRSSMKILITNDDSYTSKGIKTLVNIMKPYGEITVVAPKYHQSGMSMAVALGHKPMAARKLSEVPGERWYYLDATPSSCVKYAIDNVYVTEKPDVVLSGINHGINAGMCAPYSGTIGAASEAALARVPSFALSIDSFSRDADFSIVEELFPPIFEKLLKECNRGFGAFYNINFPYLPASQVKGIRITRLGRMHWDKEFQPYDPDIYNKIGLRPLEDLGVTWRPEPEPGEEVFAMVGDMVTDPDTPQNSDQITLKQGYITITPQNLDNTDFSEIERLKGLGFES